MALPLLDHSRTADTIERLVRQLVERPTTDVRQTFFQLLGNVVADPAEVVLIQHKDLPARGALVAEAYLDYVHRLEALTRDLANAAAEPFALVGTAIVDGDVGDLLHDLRSESRCQSEARMNTASATLVR